MGEKDWKKERNGKELEQEGGMERKRDQEWVVEQIGLSGNHHGKVTYVGVVEGIYSYINDSMGKRRECKILRWRITLKELVVELKAALDWK